MLIHKKLIYEECNFPEAVRDGGMTKGEIFSVSMTNLRNRGLTLRIHNILSSLPPSSPEEIGLKPILAHSRPP